MRIIYILGVIAVVLGALDPMEGSVAIAAGSIFIALSALFTADRNSNIFMAAAIMIFVGVSCLWFASSLGGFDPKREWWWLILILPYPIGWLTMIVTLVMRAVRRQRQTAGL